MRKWLFLPVLLTGALLFWFLYGPGGERGEGPDRAALRRASTVAAPGATAHAPGPPVAPESAEAPRRIRGTIYDPRGRPLEKAKIWRTSPKPLTFEYSDAAGRFAVAAAGAGRHVLEASYYDDYDDLVKVVLVPETGEAEEIAFRFRAKGFLFGDLRCEGKPVDDVALILRAEGEVYAECVSLDGYFAFDGDVPADAVLELWAYDEVVGRLDPPLKIAFHGEAIDLGPIEMAPWHYAHLKLRLPGEKIPETYDEEGPFTEIELYEVNVVAESGRRPLPLHNAGPNRWRLLPGAYTFVVHVDEIAFVQTFKLGPDEERTEEIAPRKRKVEAACTLVDEKQRPLRARLTPAAFGSAMAWWNAWWNRKGVTVWETDVAGSFHGSFDQGEVVALEVMQVDLEGIGWVTLDGSYYSGRVHAICDAASPRFRLQLGSRLLIHSKKACDVMLSGALGKNGNRTGYHYSTTPGRTHLSQILEAGRYHWCRTAPNTRMPGFSDDRTIEIKEGEVALLEIDG